MNDAFGILLLSVYKSERCLCLCDENYFASGDQVLDPTRSRIILILGYKISLAPISAHSSVQRSLASVTSLRECWC